MKVVLENMSKQGNTIGGDLNELKEIIDKVKDKSRMGICIDTCHAMAAGKLSWFFVCSIFGLQMLSF